MNGFCLTEVALKSQIKTVGFLLLIKLVFTLIIDGVMARAGPFVGRPQMLGKSRKNGWFWKKRRRRTLFLLRTLTFIGRTAVGNKMSKGNQPPKQITNLAKHKGREILQIFFFLKYLGILGILTLIFFTYPCFQRNRIACLPKNLVKMPQFPSTKKLRICIVESKFLGLAKMILDNSFRWGFYSLETSSFKSFLNENIRHKLYPIMHTHAK